MFYPGQASRKNLAGACIDMQRVVITAYRLLPVAKGVDMSVVESVRTIEQQKKNVMAGVSWTLDSDHIKLDADGSGVLAVDIYPWLPGIGTSHDAEHYNVVADAMFHAAQIEGVIIQWGGFWAKKHRDYPHWAKRMEALSAD